MLLLTSKTKFKNLICKVYFCHCKMFIVIKSAYWPNMIQLIKQLLMVYNVEIIGNFFKNVNVYLLDFSKIRMVGF